jgi:peptidase M50B-like protein
VTGISAFASRRWIGSWFWAAVAISLAVSLTPWAPFLLYPFKLFTTWVHESGHALMTVLVGGRVTSITIQPDTSGLTRSLIPVGRVARGLVASSGYLGAAIVGCLLMASARVEKWAHVILLGLGVLMLLSVVFWMRNPFGAAVVLAWGVVLITLARKGVANALRFFLSLLAIQVALNAVYDIRVLFLIDRSQSDAATMARLFLLPSWAWASIWMLVSVAMLGSTLWLTRTRR